MRLAMFFYCGKEPNVLSIAMASAARPFAIALIALFTIVLEPPFAQLVQQGDISRTTQRRLEKELEKPCVSRYKRHGAWDALLCNSLWS
jgi:hypothetical protein